MKQHYYKRCPLSELPEEIEISYRQRPNYKDLKFDFLAKCKDLDSYIVHYTAKRTCYVMIWKRFDGEWLVIDKDSPDPLIQEMLNHCSNFAHLALQSGIMDATMVVHTEE